ncbi:MAG: ORF6N domain-containing protein [Terriglobales bacterium]
MAAAALSPPATHALERQILLLRNQRIMLDASLAALYRVTTSHLNQAVQRNRGRFPSDFMFELTAADLDILKSQIVISSSAWGGRRSRPRAFTEHGVAMLSSVLKSPRAVRMNISIMRAFVRIRELSAGDLDLRLRLAALERDQRRLDSVMLQIVRAVVAVPGRRIGFAASAAR